MATIKTSSPIFKDRQSTMHLVADFWDKMSEGWHDIWGPHIHHGYFESNTETPLEAQELLIINLAKLLQLSKDCQILDVGCGMGGSSIYLAEHYNASVTGITLSTKQVVIATETAAQKKLKQVEFKIEDALTLSSFKDESFDVIWSLESCEQFFDKELFIKQAYRKLKPGGKLLLATWCSDQEEYHEKMATQYRKLCLAFDLPNMPTLNYYEQALARQKFSLIQVHDWSQQVKKSWNMGISLLKSASLLKIFLKGGLRGWKFTQQLKLMRSAFDEGRVRYGVFIAQK